MVSIFVLLEIILKLAWEHRKLTAEVSYIFNGSNRRFNWIYYILLDSVQRIGDYHFRRLWKTQNFHCLRCIRSTKSDCRIEILTSIGFDVIYHFAWCYVEAVRINQPFLLLSFWIVKHLIHLQWTLFDLWCSLDITRINSDWRLIVDCFLESLLFKVIEI